MFTSRTFRTTAAAAALVLSLAACGGADDDSSVSDDGPGIETSSQEDAPEDSAEGTDEAGSEDEDAADDEGTDDAEESDDDGDAADSEDDGSAGEEAGTVTITLDGEETSFTPEIVRCNGEPGTIRNAILTMRDDELPLIKVTPGEFAMVKLDNRGEPEKTSSLEGITAEDGTITFDEASIGDATVDGTVECLQGNQG